jgi:hypothetical protein
MAKYRRLWKCGVCGGEVVFDSKKGIMECVNPPAGSIACHAAKLSYIPAGQLRQNFEVITDELG